MKIKPAEHRILVQFYFPVDPSIVLAEPTLMPSAEENRTRVEVLAIGDKVDACKVGDFLLVHDDSARLAVPISKEPPTALLHDSMVIAIVLDDAQHVR